MTLPPGKKSESEPEEKAKPSKPVLVMLPKNPTDEDIDKFLEALKS